MPASSGSYDPSTSMHKMIYYGEDTDVYIEDLESGAQQWELARSLERRNLPSRTAKPDSFSPSPLAGAAGRKSSYLDMVLEVRSSTVTVCSYERTGCKGSCCVYQRQPQEFGVQQRVGKERTCRT